MIDKLLDGNFHSFDISATHFTNILSKNKSIIFYNTENKSTTSLDTDILEKDIKYYPTGNKLFTTTDSQFGLRVWDAICLENIFTYSNEDIKSHCYNTTKFLISAALDSGIKFYDLRCRYFVQFLSLRQCKRIKWYNDNFVGIGEDFIIDGDIRNYRKAVLKRVTGICDYEKVESEKNDYAIVSYKNKRYIKIIDSPVDIEKECFGCIIHKFEKNNTFLMIPYKNKLKITNNDYDNTIELEEISGIKDIKIDLKNSNFYLNDLNGLFKINFDKIGT